MSTPQIIILIVLIALVVFSLAWIIIPILRRRYVANHLVPHFGKRIYHIALYNDFYLINQINLKLDDDNEAHIDHLLFGEKYIYVIKDRYYDGALTGQARDVNWMFYQRFGRRGKFIANPFLLNRVRVEKLALVTGLDPHFFISVIVTNDQCLLDEIDTKDNATFIVKLKKLEKLIKTIEEREIEPIDPNQLDRAVKDIHRLVKG